jgi:hypothetical protein
MTTSLFRCSLSRSARCLGVATALTCVVLTAVANGAPSDSSASIDRVNANSVSTPLATSLQSTAGTWVTLPMGRLAQPLNTFWQLFFRPAGATSWTNKVGATATATNGGLIMASAAGQPFVAAVRPANLLHFSPLIATTDAGTSWTNGLLPQGLSPSPDSLSIAPNGHAVGLVKSGLDAEVLVNNRGLSRWEVVTTARRLAASTAGTKCRVQSLSAVLADPAMDYVGAACAQPGVVGILVGGVRGWHLVAPPLPEGLRRGLVEVLSLQETSAGLSALLGIATTTKEAFVTASLSQVGGQWTVSPVLTLSPHERLASFGPAKGSGFFILGVSSSGVPRLAYSDGSRTGWSLLPEPPRFTETVAFSPVNGAPLEALAAHGKTMTVWSLAPGELSWEPGQVVRVALTYGSSS